MAPNFLDELDELFSWIYLSSLQFIKPCKKLKNLSKIHSSEVLSKYFVCFFQIFSAGYGLKESNQATN